MYMYTCTYILAVRVYMYMYVHTYRETQEIICKYSMTVVIHVFNLCQGQIQHKKVPRS